MVYWCTAFLHPNAMLFRAYKPGPPLSDFIEDFSLYDGYSSAYVRKRIFPTGTFERLFNLRDDELQIYEWQRVFFVQLLFGSARLRTVRRIFCYRQGGRGLHHGSSVPARRRIPVSRVVSLRVRKCTY